MDRKGGFFTDNSFAVYLNISIGHHVPNLDSLIRSRRSIIGLSIYKIISDIFVLITFITLTIRLVSPDVPIAERSSGVLTTITTYQAVAKIIFFVVKRKDFHEFFELWNNSFVDLPFKEEHQKIMKTELRRVKIIALVLLITMTGPAIPWCLMPFVPFVQKVHGGRFLAVPASYPFDYLTTPNFEMVIIFQTFAAVFTIAKSVIFDSFFISIAALVVVNFRHLNVCMENLFIDGDADLGVGDQSRTSMYVENMVPMDKELTGTDVMKMSPASSTFAMEYMPNVPELPMVHPDASTSQSGYRSNMTGIAMQRTNSVRQNDKLLLKLKLWSKQHQDLITLGNKLHALYSPILLMQFLTTTVILCFSAFIVVGVSMDSMQYLLSAAYGVGNIVQLFVLCHYGDRIADSSVSLSDAGLANGWEACHVKKVTSSLKIIYQRVQKPLQIFAMSVYPLSAETFFAIVKAAISYLMVLIELHSKSQPEESVMNVEGSEITL